HRPLPYRALTRSSGAGSPRHEPPRSNVRRITVHGRCAHGALPRTNAVCDETNVTLVAFVRAGTGPPAGVESGRAMAAVATASTTPTTTTTILIIDFRICPRLIVLRRWLLRARWPATGSARCPARRNRDPDR